MKKLTSVFSLLLSLCFPLSGMAKTCHLYAEEHKPDAPNNAPIVKFKLVCNGAEEASPIRDFAGYDLERALVLRLEGLRRAENLKLTSCSKTNAHYDCFLQSED